MTEIQPRIQAAVGRGSVRLVGAEDIRELVQDGICMAARMLAASEDAGAPLMPSSVAFYTLKALRSGRRFNSAGRMDAMGAGAMLDQKVHLVSLDEARETPDDDMDGEITLHDLLAASGEDAGDRAARHLDWDAALQTMNVRMRGVLSGTAQGMATMELAKRYKISAPRVCQVREAAGAKIASAWGGRPLTDAMQEVAWSKQVRTYAQKRACRAERAAKRKAGSP